MEVHVQAPAHQGATSEFGRHVAGAFITAAGAFAAAIPLALRRHHAQRRWGAHCANAVAQTAPTPASTDSSEQVDVAVVGGGPAGTLLAHILAEKHQASVCLIDPNVSRDWVNNYGVWQAEWDALEARLQLGLHECLGSKWDVTDCYFGGSYGIPVESKLRLDEPYARVDRYELKARLQSDKIKVVEEALDAEAVANNIFAGGLCHDEGGSTLTLRGGRRIRAKLVVDATGSESKITRRLQAAGETPPPKPGFQIAYGFECVCDGPFHYAAEAMTLFDYRTDHLSSDKSWEKQAEKAPTFMYVMPLGTEPGGGYRVFFEETSLVARPGVSFEDCKKRCMARLDFLGVKVRPGTITDKEYCYIPMGGPLPEPGQRVIAFGGAAVMVHPATGYQLCRMMASSADVAEAIGRHLSTSGDFKPDAAAAAAYESMWSQANQAQRDFAVFGGEFLMDLDVTSLRAWFDGFFRLPTPLWAGFLAGWPGLPGNDNHESWLSRISFGLQLFVKLPPQVAAKLALAIGSFTLTYGISLLRSVTPLFGGPPAYTWSPPLKENEIGDPAAKREARAMIAAD